MPRWIVFDAVGTLIHPVPSVGEAYWRIGVEFGSRLTADEVTQRFRSAFRRIFGPVGAEFRSDERLELERWRETVSAVLDDVPEPEACFDAIYRHFSRPEAWALFDDAGETIGQLLDRGVQVAVASNFDHRLHEVMDGLAPLDRIGLRVISSEAGYRKPGSGFYRELCRRTEAEPRDLLMVGDHPELDVAAAEAAGLDARLIDRKGEHAGHPRRIGSLTELLSWFGD